LKVYHDWEFLEAGNSVHPLSVGMVTEDGDELYYEFIDAPWDRVYKHQWLMANVMPEFSKGHNTALVIGRSNDIVKSTLAIRLRIYDFLAAAANKSPLELWGWYSSYDHVCLGQLFGSMIKLPSFVPMYTNDIKQEADRLNVKIPDLRSSNEPVHHALADARVESKMHKWLMNYELAKTMRVSHSRGIQFGDGNTQVNKY
jgi:3'-5' exoribonuclease-like protein